MTNITRVKSINGSSIDVFLTNKITSFHHTVPFESGLSDSHKIILTFFRAHIKKLPHKNIEYQSFKKFYRDHFLHGLDFEFSKGTTYKVKDNQYDILTNIFRILLDKYAPIKSKKIEEITCLLCQRNWVKKLKRNCFIEITSKGVTGNKDFWNVVKLFLTYKGFLNNEDIAITFDNRTITDDKELSKIFNEYYINIAQNTTGTSLVKISWKYELNNNNLVVEKIIKNYENYPKIQLIKDKVFSENKGSAIESATVEEINEKSKHLNLKKTTGHDKILVKTGKLAADITDSHLTNIVNN